MRISDLVLHNDHQLIAFNKPGGMPTQDDKSGDASLHKLAQAYSKRDLYVVHRLDRPCSGIVFFAKTQAASAHLSAQWKARTITKKYLAIVSPGITPLTGILEHSLVKRGNKSVISTADTEGDASQKAILEYRILAKLDNYDLLEVTTHTGYFHQIRAQLSAAGFPIKDDVKYGARRSNKERTIYLHCAEITFVHPGTHQELTLHCSPPEEPLWVMGDG
ncbi:MAG TPA: RluA family pseudouridine synthase [Saprospiraceae bacterium]|nr:RluA family pseudouridine synthase [Saprospiraceae bacterium]